MKIKRLTGVAVSLGLTLANCATQKKIFYQKSELIQPYSNRLENEELYRAPYVSKFNNDQKSLWFAAVQHTDKIDSPSFKTILKAFDQLQPQVVIIEGVEDTGVFSPKSHSEYVKKMADRKFEGSSETTYAAWLALEKGIPYAPAEPSALSIALAFEGRGHKREDFAYFDILRMIPHWKRTEKTHNLDDYKSEAQILGKYNFHSMGINNQFSFDSFLVWYQNKIGRAFQYETLNMEYFSPQLEGNPTALNRLSSEVDEFREKHLHEITVRMLNQFNRVLIVFGSGHLVKHRAALTALLGKSSDEKWFTANPETTENHFTLPPPLNQKKDGDCH